MEVVEEMHANRLANALSVSLSVSVPLCSRSVVPEDLENSIDTRRKTEIGCVDNLKMENGAKTSAGPATEKLERERFMDVYQLLARELVEDSNLFRQTEDSCAWILEMLDYNVPGGKLNRGLSVVHSLKILKENVTDEVFFQACVLGWCIEWMQAFFLISDDIMDRSITRRGKPCWYRVPHVGFIAVNDGILLNCQVYRILKKHFGNGPFYAQLVDLFTEVTFQTASGQLLDLITSPEGRVDLSKYTMTTYLQIVKYKTAFYSFFLPVACAMVLAGEKDQERFATAKGILVQMGTYFQAQDDFLDCYGDPDYIGKVGTDIEDSKCSWLVVKALQLANEEQTSRIEANYGKPERFHVDEVKRVYNELKLKAAFEEFENESYKEIVSAIAKVDSSAYQNVFHSFLSKIYQRSK